MRRLKTVRRPPIYPNEPSHLPCSSLTHPAAVLTPSIGVLRWIRAYYPPNPKITMLNDAGRADVIAHMIEQGYGDKILTGHDVAQKLKWTAYGGHGYFFILKQVVPWLKIRGFTDDDLERLLVHNRREYSRSSSRPTEDVDVSRRVPPPRGSGGTALQPASNRPLRMARWDAWCRV